jgi:hypothetical protein
MPPLEAAERKLVLDYLQQNYPARAPSRQGGWQNRLPRHDASASVRSTLPETDVVERLGWT